MKTKSLASLGLKSFVVMAAAVVGFVSVVMFAYADTAPTFTTTAYNQSNTAITSAPIGTNVLISTAVASSSTTTLPTGSVTFNQYANTSCTGTANVQANVPLVNGTATSSAVAMTASGLSYIPHYSGDGANVAADGVCKSVSASASSVSITGVLSTTTAILAGSSVTESATLSGATGNAGGSVAYTVYSNNSCTALWGSDGSKTVTNAVVPTSEQFSFGVPGSYWWQAVYSGDGSNGMATSSCLALSVVASSNNTAATVSGNVYNDVNTNSTKDSGESGVSGLTVNLYQGAGFGGSIFQTTSTDGNGNYSFGSLADGTYSVDLVTPSPWQQETADYNSVSVSGQNSLTNINFAIHNPATTTTPTPGAGSISGTFYNDANHNDTLDSGETLLSGFTVNLYKGAGWWGKSGNNDVFMSATTDASGHYSFNNLADGVYSVEEIEMAAFSQTTSDYKALTIKNGSVLVGKDFGNISRSVTPPPTIGGHGDGDNDGDDNATSTNNGGNGSGNQGGNGNTGGSGGSNGNGNNGGNNNNGGNGNGHDNGDHGNTGGNDTGNHGGGFNFHGWGSSGRGK